MQASGCHLRRGGVLLSGREKRSLLEKNGGLNQLNHLRSLAMPPRIPLSTLALRPSKCKRHQTIFSQPVSN